MKVVDMHCDTISALLKKRRANETASLLENDIHISIGKMKEGDYLLQNFALFVEKEACRDPWEEVQALIEFYKLELAKHGEWIAPVLSYGDIKKNAAKGKISAMLTVEEGAVCGGSLKNLRTLYHQGVRMMTLLWNYPNELGFPNLDRVTGKNVRAAAKKEKDGETLVLTYLNTPSMRALTETGITFIMVMEEMGMIIDVSHMSDGGFYDVLKHTKKPFVASHSNARQICPCVRNLSDAMIRALAERGGVLGLNFCADFLTQLPFGVYNPGTIEGVVSHAKHIANVGGIDCLGLGSDFDGIDTHEILTGGDKMGLLWDALKKSGFTECELDKIFTENVLRVYREVLK